MNSDKTKKVLIALDYDQTAQKVAEAGYALAKSMGAETILMHVIADMLYYFLTEYSPVSGIESFYSGDESEQENTDVLKNASFRFLEKSKLQLGDENIKTVVCEGDFADSILKMANDLGADIIVIGSNSNKWLGNVAIGSIIEKILYQTNIPLFIIPTKIFDLTDSPGLFTVGHEESNSITHRNSILHSKS
jgi:nucleotide-binding universal stress UspA family protein